VDHEGSFNGRILSSYCSANPYMFGLSIAGGLVTLGIEGAVIGPMMLCFLVIVMECYKMAIQSRFLDSNLSEEENGQTTNEVIPNEAFKKS
jgi:predicted PurR-regulated permease PerM